MKELVVTTIAEGIAFVNLNDPEALNAVGIEMGNALTEAFQGLERNDEVRAVILSGHGRIFSAGGHLKDALASASLGPSGAAAFMAGYNRLVRTIFYFPKPIISTIRGMAAGGALGIVLCTDFIMLAADARLMQAFIHIGLAPDCGTSVLLAHRVGIGRAKELTLTGRQVGAEEALRIGLADAVYETAELEEQAKAMATLIASKPPLAVSQSKLLMQQAQFSSLHEALDQEAAIQAMLMQSCDFAEGANAFLERRTPKFIGR